MKKYFYFLDLPEYEKRNLLTQHVLHTVRVCVNSKQLITSFAYIGYSFPWSLDFTIQKIPTDKSNVINPILSPNRMNKLLLICLHRRNKEPVEFVE